MKFINKFPARAGKIDINCVWVKAGFFAVAMLAAMVFFGAKASAAEELKCNGSAELCGRRFNEVAFPSTHNSMSAADENWHLPNQPHGIYRQLRDGVRGINIDLHYFRDEVYTCHTFCGLGRKSLVSALAEIKKFMDENPGEIVTLIFENYASAKDVADCFEKSGLLPYALAQKLGAPWPTLGEMVRNGRRLVVLTDNAGGVYPWLMSEWKYAWETNWSNRTLRDFNCNPDRGSQKNDLFIMPEQLTGIFPNPIQSLKSNSNPFFINRVRECYKETGRLPNFPTVDFYDAGNLFDVAKETNTMFSARK